MPQPPHALAHYACAPKGHAGADARLGGGALARTYTEEGAQHGTSAACLHDLHDSIGGRNLRPIVLLGVSRLGFGV